MFVDEIDLSIIKILEENSKLTYKEIGEKVHMTGQAVGARVTKLMDEGVIENFTISTNKQKLGIIQTSFVKIYMKTNEHNKVKKIIDSYEEVVEAFRISSDGCYMLKIETNDPNFLNNILEEIIHFGNYQVSISLGQLK